VPGHFDATKEMELVSEAGQKRKGGEKQMSISKAAGMYRLQGATR